MRLMLLGALLLAATGLAPPRPAAAAVDLFRVAGIPVDATAASAVAAREQAIASGEREGLRQLLRRLTLPEDAAHLPPVEGLRTDDYVQATRSPRRSRAPTRYIATLNVSYVPDQVRTLLRGANVPFLDRRPEPVLLLPVLETEQGPESLGRREPVARRLERRCRDQPAGRAAAAARRRGRSLGRRRPQRSGSPFRARPALRRAARRHGDVSSVTPASLSDPGALSALAQRYGAQLAVTADAKPRPAASGPPAVALTVTPSDTPDQPFLRETVTGQPAEDQAALLGQAVQRTVAAVELGIKRRLIVRDTQLSTIRVGVPLADLSSWVQIRRTLGGVPEVRSVRVDSFGRPEAMVSIDYAGGLDGLTAAMQRAGLALDEENGGWRLRQAGGPGGLQGQRSASPATP